MDTYEATRIVFSRIHSLDPENASKIMGLLLIQDHGEKELIRLAFGPETLVHSVVIKARNELGISSNTLPTPSTPSSISPFKSLSRQNSSSRFNLPPQTTSFSWAPSVFSDLQNPDELISPRINNTITSSSSTSLSWPFSANNGDFIDEFHLQDQLSFLNDSSTMSSNGLGVAEAIHFPSYAGPDSGQHRRSYSFTDISSGFDAGTGFGWKPCLYFARGFCKNGTNCRFLHGFPDSAPVVGDSASIDSPGKLDIIEQYQELLQSKNSLLMPASGSTPYTGASGKYINFLLQQEQQHQNGTQRMAAALMMGEDIKKFGHSRLERNEFSTNGGTGLVNPVSRQIYLTFPADSTFREEDVSNYFSIYGPVQDVRIPYQQKRMFGFVTFVYPETVKLILAKGNPHFVCDARVLVKPYKEKGKVPDKNRKQQTERGEFSACSSPTGFDSRDAYDLIGNRMFYNTQEMLPRRKLEEQAELHQAIELQSRRMMGLHLLDVKKQLHRNLSSGATIPSPIYSPTHQINQCLNVSSDRSSPETLGGHYIVPGSCGSLATTTSIVSTDQKVEKAVTTNKDYTNDDNGKEENPNCEDGEFHDSLEHNLPESPFASPKKNTSIFTSSTSLISASLQPASSTLDVSSLKSCYYQLPRLSSGHGTIGM